MTFTPEQRVWIDQRIGRVQRRLAIGFGILACGGVIGGYELNGVIHNVDHKTHKELTNRAKNVHVWCEGIDENRRALRANHLKAPADLPCVELEQNTLRSGAPK